MSHWPNWKQKGPANLTRLHMKCDLCKQESNLFLIIEDTRLQDFLDSGPRRFPTICSDYADKKTEIETETAYKALAKPDYPVKCLDGIFGVL